MSAWEHRKQCSALGCSEVEENGLEVLGPEGRLGKKIALTGTKINWKKPEGTELIVGLENSKKLFIK